MINLDSSTILLEILFINSKNTMDDDQSEFITDPIDRRDEELAEEEAAEPG